MIDELRNNLIERVPFQQDMILKSLKMLDKDMEILLDKYICYMKYIGKNEDAIADSYVFLNEETKKQQLLYYRNLNRYTYDNKEDIIINVYSDDGYMDKYMDGLGISIFIWPQHIKAFELFKREINKLNFSNLCYMEIGGGSGLYAMYALTSGFFSKGTLVDVSSKSLEKTKEILEYSCPHIQKDYVCMDITKYNDEKQYDFITANGVLQSVDDPLKLLLELKDKLKETGKLFVAFPVNAAMIDCVYKFKSKDEIISMFRQAGFSILEESYVTYKGKPIEVCISKNYTVNASFILLKA